jgi:hypothetical protein
LSQEFTQIATAINKISSILGFDGRINSNGTIAKGNQFTVANPSTGRYDVSYKDYETEVFPVVTPVSSAVRSWALDAVSTTGFTVRFWDSANALVDTEFHFHLRGYMEEII